MVGECLTLLLHEAVQEGERDEAEEDDKENSTADHSLGLWDLLLAELVEVLATEARGDKVAIVSTRILIAKELSLLKTEAPFLKRAL